MKILSLLICSFTLTTSIYTLSYTNIDGVTQSMNQYQGKKILMVNFATGSARVAQLAQLQQLQTTYANKVTVIGFPDNSFGFEARTNAEIKTFCQTNYGVTFPLASKNSVLGTNIQSIYNWLTKKSENSMMNQEVKSDFQKFLVNEQGVLIGVFAANVDPMSTSIVNAINDN